VVVVVLEVVPVWVLAGAGVEGETGVEGEAGAEGGVPGAWSEMVDVASFFSPVVGAGASLSADGFSLSE
jgi:hypothetical protein